MKNRKIIKKVNNNIRGITMVALVVTIIVLLILAGVAISLTVGNNGIFTRAKSAANEWEKAVHNERQVMQNFIDDYDKIINDAISDKQENWSQKDITKITGDETENTKTQDKNGNKIIIPAGFKVINPEDDITKGIVIEDVSANDETSKGNQYVWIPVTHVDGNKVNKIKDSDGHEHTIELARYTFNVGTYDTLTKEFTGTGKILTKVINGENIPSVSNTFIEETEEQHKISGKDNAIAKDINKFKEKVKNVGGFYIARYEAGDSTANNVRNSSSSQTVIPVFKKNKITYNCITQNNSAALISKLYSNQSKNYESDLVNSYAWDTAIVFIQEFSENSDYSKHNCLQTTLSKTGQATDGSNQDIRCNIYDMAGNVYEWTTETSSKTSEPCNFRGGSYNGKGSSTAGRSNVSINYSHETLGMRRHIIFIEISFSLSPLTQINYSI